MLAIILPYFFCNIFFKSNDFFLFWLCDGQKISFFLIKNLNLQLIFCNWSLVIWNISINGIRAEEIVKSYDRKYKMNLFLQYVFWKSFNDLRSIFCNSQKKFDWVSNIWVTYIESFFYCWVLKLVSTCLLR